MPQEVAQMYVVCLAPSEAPKRCKSDFDDKEELGSRWGSVTAGADSVHLVGPALLLMPG